MRTLAFLTALLAAVLALAVAPALAAPPAAWEPRGAGGGGALFEPAWSPHSVDELWVACDVPQPFHTINAGGSWERPDFRQLRGGALTGVRFSSDPLRLYALEQSVATDQGLPKRSGDGGRTWEEVPGNPAGEDAWSLHADPAAAGRLVLTDYTRLWLSDDGGQTFVLHVTDPAGVHVAGVAWNGDAITIGLRDRLLVSSDGGRSFTPTPLAGIPPDEHVVSFAGSTDGVTTRFVAVTLGAGDVEPGVRGSDHDLYRGVYVLTQGSPGWTRSTAGIDAADHPFFAAMTPGRPDVAWLAGGSDRGEPIAYRSTDGGGTWAPSFLAPGNANVRTGWSGAGGDRGWGYGELAFGFAASPIDTGRAAFTDYGFVHLTTDGGVTWRQAYLDPAGENPAGAPTPRGRAYRSSGLENTSHWHLTWTAPERIWSSATDIRGVRSTDGGLTWSFDSTGHSLNTMYHAVSQAATGTLYGATSSVHDLYQSTYLQDARIDGGRGEVLSSRDDGRTWELVHDFGQPVIWLALDPTDPDRAWASVVHSAEGGVWATASLQAGAASTWVRLAEPPRTEGHPFNVHRLGDGTLVATYSGRRDAGGAFTPSSGVFVSIDGGASWIDRSHADMHWWTKDLTVDPHDPTQSTWHVGVWSGWGGPPNGRGGLFRTTDRGRTWTRILTLDRVSGAWTSPVDPDEGWLTTETEGLWHSADLTSAVPTWTQVDFPVPHPERVFWNPLDPAEVWVTTFGSGLFVGRAQVAAPALLRNAEVTRLSPLAPPLSAVLPLDPAPPPVGDRHVDAFASGDVDPDATVVGDPSRPLVFYAIDGDVSIRLSITPDRHVAIAW